MVERGEGRERTNEVFDGVGLHGPPPVARLLVEGAGIVVALVS